MILHTIVAWLMLGAGLALSAGYLGVGATLVRKAQPIAGYLLVAAGAVGLLLGCCTALGRFVSSPDAGPVIAIVLNLAGLAHTLLHGGCLVGAAFQLSKAACSEAAPVGTNASL